MKINSRLAFRAAPMIALMLILTLVSGRLHADSGVCGAATTNLPFTDVPASNIFFCSIASAYFTGLTNGTTPTTYSPTANVPREQMAAFVSRTMDQSLKRGSRRAALKEFWTPTSEIGLGLTTVGSSPYLLASDGADLWVPNVNTISRVRASDGKLLETWTGALQALAVLSAKGLIFVTGLTFPSHLYQIDPTLPAGAVTTLPISLGVNPQAIAFDGARIWTANTGIPGSVSIVSLSPLSVNTVETDFSAPVGILYDGTNIWVTDSGKLVRLDSSGAVIQAVATGANPRFPVFDGTNIWVPNLDSNSVTVVRASTGAILATLVGNGLIGPATAAFDGERILVTNLIGDSVSMWKAADLTPLGSVMTGSGSNPIGACSDGLNFWVTLNGTGKLARF